MEPVDVSVVVCTFNRGDMLRNALSSLTVLETLGRFCHEALHWLARTPS